VPAPQAGCTPRRRDGSSLPCIGLAATLVHPVQHPAAMSSDLSSIHNHHERAVFQAVNEAAPRFAHLIADDLLPDVACVALNRLPPRYIRHEADLAFYLSDKERIETQRAVDEAVAYAFEFVQARAAMRARG
jgi:hypothetical protein